MFSVLVTPPAVEPIDLEDAKAHCRVTHSAEDDLIEAYVSAARQYAEEYTKRAFITQTWRATLDAFPYRRSSRLVLARPPILSITEVAYTDGNGADQVLAAEGYTFANHPVEPYVVPAYGTEWPTPRDSTGAVRVTYTAGYGPSEYDVPEAIRNAIRLLTQAEYERAADDDHLRKVAMRILDPYRVRVAA